MAILVIADIINDELSSDQTGKTVSAISGLGEVTILCALSGLMPRFLGMMTTTWRAGKIDNRFTQSG